MTLPNLIEEVKKEFDEKFIQVASDRTKSGMRLDCDPEYAKSFLSTAITRAWNEGLDEGVKEIEKLMIPNHRTGVADGCIHCIENAHLTASKKVLEKLKK